MFFQVMGYYEADEPTSVSTIAQSVVIMCGNEVIVDDGKDIVIREKTEATRTWISVDLDTRFPITVPSLMKLTDCGMKQF
jgi:hypothetical protein